MGALRRLTILHYVDQLIAARERAANGQHAAIEAEIDRRISGIDREIRIAQAAFEHRLDAMNEFRASLADQASRNVSTELFTTTVDALNAAREAGLGAIRDRVKALEDAQARTSGRAAGTTAVIAAVGLIATVVTLILLFIHFNGG